MLKAKLNYIKSDRFSLKSKIETAVNNLRGLVLYNGISKIKSFEKANSCSLHLQRDVLEFLNYFSQFLDIVIKDYFLILLCDQKTLKISEKFKENNWILSLYIVCYTLIDLRVEFFKCFGP